VKLLETYPQETVGEPVRERRVCQLQAERGKGKNDMVNPGELSINIVMSNKPKQLTGLDQKVSRQVLSLIDGNTRSTTPAGGQTEPTSFACSSRGTR
jgi:hypothetical protein